MKALKALIILVLFAILAGGLNLWYNTYYLGQMWANAGPFITIIGGLAPIVGIVAFIWAVIALCKFDPKTLAMVAVLGASFASVSCDRAISNMQTLVSDDCGKSWKLIGVGQVIPKRIGPCALKVTVPNYPMTGDAVFKVNFKNRVLVGVSASYEYTITDPVKFIDNARYLGRQNSAGDSEANSLALYETAENLLIDRRIREVASELLQKEDIVDFDQGKFEDVLLEKCNKELVDRGLTLASMAFVPTPDVQTRQAIDTGAAVRVYDALGQAELGRAMMVQRAGAPTIIVEDRDNGPKK